MTRMKAQIYFDFEGPISTETVDAMLAAINPLGPNARVRLVLDGIHVPYFDGIDDELPPAELAGLDEVDAVNGDSES